MRKILFYKISIKNQKSKIKNQKSKIKNQKSKIKNQIKNQKSNQIKTMQASNNQTIKQFIQKNRTSFDSEVPPALVWENVEKNLPRKQVHIYRRLRMAAAVLLILGLGIAIGRFEQPSETELALSDISNEYAELENFYTEKINQKISLLKNQQSDEQALADIKDLEQEFEVLKRELNATDAQDEQIIQAMIENYRTKIDILERVLKRTNYSTKTKENESSI